MDPKEIRKIAIGAGVAGLGAFAAAISTYLASLPGESAVLLGAVWSVAINVARKVLQAKGWNIP